MSKKQLFVDYSYHCIMTTKTMLLTALIVALMGVSYCSEHICSCTCCTGNSCTPTLQGAIAVPSCAGLSCKSVCQDRYPTQCSDSSNSTVYQCKSGDSPLPDWVGIFDTTRRCDATTCCCPIGQIVLWGVTPTTLRILMLIAGQSCNGSTSVDQTVTIPSSFLVEISFHGRLIQASLSQDSYTIQLNDRAFPSCNEIIVRHEPRPISQGTINLVSLFLLTSVVSLRQFIL